MTQEKIALIDKLVLKHPSYGVGCGWSEYTGGMADTGRWYFRKILDEPMEKIQDLLDYINRIESQPPKPQTKSIEELNKEFKEEIERKLIWGVKTNRNE